MVIRAIMKDWSWTKLIECLLCWNLEWFQSIYFHTQLVKTMRKSAKQQDFIRYQIEITQQLLNLTHLFKIQIRPKLVHVYHIIECWDSSSQFVSILNMSDLWGNQLHNKFHLIPNREIWATAQYHIYVFKILIRQRESKHFGAILSFFISQSHEIFPAASKFNFWPKNKHHNPTHTTLGWKVGRTKKFKIMGEKKNPAAVSSKEGIRRGFSIFLKGFPCIFDIFK